MERESIVCTTLLLSVLIFIIIRFKKSNSHYQRLPPSPPGWPVFGHVFSLGIAPHRAIAALKPKYGPVVWLKLGSIDTMAILTAKAALELFKNHDLSFVDRSVSENMTTNGFSRYSLALAPYGSRWRELRRLCTVEMLSNKRINETAGMRQKCVENMISWIEKERMNNNGGILIRRYVFFASFNMMGNLVMSRDLVDPESETGTEFFDAVKRMMEWAGKPNVSDLFPWLRWIDIVQGLKKKVDHNMEIVMGVVSSFVKERIEQRKNGEGKEKDFLDVVLEFEGCNGKLSQKEIVIFMLEIFLAGSESTSSSIEWAMTELLRNPETLAKAKHEISCVIGPNKKLKERDLDNINLPYMHAVIKETLRLHPPMPFLLPRRAVHDTNFMDYFIPKNTQVFVNVWAVGRDPECWDDPFSFKPDRFLGSNIDYKGHHFELIPFGAGRRMCGGVPLGHRMLHFVLGSLIHEFDWELERSLTPHTLDMSERLGTTVEKLEPLKVLPRK